VFSFCIASIHAASEVVVSSIFYFGGNLSPAYFERGFVVSVLLLVGLGTIIHSMIDFEIACVILFPLKKQKYLSEYFAKS